ncbi:MAG: TIM barrel protein, partial [Terriglobales bacterium]
VATRVFLAALLFAPLSFAPPSQASASGKNNIQIGLCGSTGDAERQFVDFCKRIALEARTRNITIAIEPLRPQESNLINTMEEGPDLVAAVNDPNIQLNLYYYHFEMKFL